MGNCQHERGPDHHRCGKCGDALPADFVGAPKARVVSLHVVLSILNGLQDGTSNADAKYPDLRVVWELQVKILESAKVLIQRAADLAPPEHARSGDGAIRAREREAMSEPTPPGVPANDSQPMRNDEEYILGLLKRIADQETMISDLEFVLADKRRLTRELDVAMHGEEGAAPQAGLVDLIKLAAKLRAEVLRLEGLVYVPGLWRCARCKCSVVSNTLNVVTSQVKANNQPMQCPNECGPLWRVTERDAGNELAERMNETRNATLDQVKKLVGSYVKSPTATVVHFLGQIDADVREAELAPKRAAAAEIVKLIDGLKGPA